MNKSVKRVARFWLKRAGEVSIPHIRLVETFAKGGGKTSEFNMNLLQEVLALLGWSLLEGVGVTPLQDDALKNLDVGSFRQWVVKYGGKNGLLLASNTLKDDSFFRVGTPEEAQEGVRTLWQFVERCPLKGPLNPQRGKVYLAEAQVYHEDHPWGTEDGIMTKGWYYGVTSYRAQTATGATLTFTTPIDSFGYMSEATRMKAPSFVTWAYKNGLQEAATQFLTSQEQEITQVRQERELSIRSLHNTGTCPACFRNVKLVPSQQIISRHGWEVQQPEWWHGRTHSEACFGTGWSPFELSKEGTVAYRVVFLEEKRGVEEALAQHMRRELTVFANKKVIKSDHPKYEVFWLSQKRNIEAKLVEAEDFLRTLDARISSWTLKPLPGDNVSRVAYQGKRLVG